MSVKTTLFDGAMGTMLYGMGLNLECPELLNINSPEIISTIHRQYAEAGAEYVKTNTFGGSPLKLLRSENDSIAFDLNQAGLRLAAASGAKTAGDIGPSGELYAPYGSVGTMDIYNSYMVQALALKGADLILIETMSSLVEANLAYLAVRSMDLSVPVIMSFTYNNGYTMMGCTPVLIAKALNGVNLLAIGANCSSGPEGMLPVIESYAANTRHKICVMPNAGLPELKDGAAIYPYEAGKYAEAMKALIQAGADIIGGCCGTTPKHIAELKKINVSPAKRHIKGEIFAATEREFAPISLAVETGPDEESILAIEEQGRIARIDVTGIGDLENYFNSLNSLSGTPKCFTATAEQELMVRILYQGVTDISIR